MNKKTNKGIDKKTNKKNTQRLILGVIFLAVVISAAVVVSGWVNRRKADELYVDLQKNANEIPISAVMAPAEESPGGAIEENITDVADGESERTEKVQKTDYLALYGVQIPKKNIDWSALKELNADIYAWIYVPDTTVDYPILQHPTDNSYYLNYNLDGTKGFPGCIYTESYNRKDFTDLHTVIYGHNLKDKTMFTSLHNFENAELVNENHFIYIYTESYVFVYLIFGAYDYSNIHLLANFNLEEDGVYEWYLNSIFQVPESSKRVANIRNDIEVTPRNRILTLSTCTRDSNEDYRYLVVGKLLNPQGEQ